VKAGVVRKIVVLKMTHLQEGTTHWWSMGADAGAVIVAIVALIFSVGTFIKQLRDQRRLKYLEALQSNGALLLETWKQLASVPSALRFHSITEEQLKECGVSKEELIYLVILFESADYYYQHLAKGKGSFKEGSLRYALLQNPATRRAWPLIKPFFIASTRYVERVDQTIRYLDLIDQSSELNKQKLNRS
jgi:hypothetical protein